MNRCGATVKYEYWGRDHRCQQIPAKGQAHCRLHGGEKAPVVEKRDVYLMMPLRDRILGTPVLYFTETKACSLNGVGTIYRNHRWSEGGGVHCPRCGYWRWGMPK